MGEAFHGDEDCIERAREELFHAFENGEIDEETFDEADRVLADAV